MTQRNIGTYRFTIGDYTVTALNDGQFEAGTGVLAGIAPAAAEAALQASFRVLPPRITVSAFLLEHAGRTTLVDTGCANRFGAAMGQVGRHLDRLGIDRASVGTVLITHAHVDHVAGLLAPDGSAAFPNAEIVLHEAEAGFWLDEARAAAAPEAARGSFALAQDCLRPYQDRTRRLRDGAEAMPGVSICHLPGHTPGHSGWRISSGNDDLLIWGDIVHLPGLQFARPEACMTFDIDAAQAEATRRRVFDMVTTDRLRVAGMHLDFPAFGHVSRAGAGYAFVPEVWRPD